MRSAVIGGLSAKRGQLEDFCSRGISSFFAAAMAHQALEQPRISRHTGTAVKSYTGPATRHDTSPTVAGLQHRRRPKGEERLDSNEGLH